MMLDFANSKDMMLDCGLLQLRGNWSIDFTPGIKTLDCSTL
jgi:hypothetical protein